jgi:hypothetical protein
MDSAATNDAPEHPSPIPSSGTLSDGSSRTLSPVSATAMNTLNINTSTENKAVETDVSEDQILDQHDSFGENDAINTNHSTRINGTVLPSSHINVDRSPLPRPNPISVSPTVRNISAEFGPLRSYANFAIAEDSTASNGRTSPQQQWSSAVGRANLGKSGRVIDKLMGDNDMLKKNLDIAKIAAEDAKQAQKLAEARMEAMSSEYEGRLHDAAINRALLKKRDRQVLDLKAQIDGERQRATAAIESERNWRAAMEKMEVESKLKVDEATTYSLLLEGRNNTLTNHWKTQSAILNDSMAKMKDFAAAIERNRQEDCRKMSLLEELCESKDHALESLRKEKQAIQDAFQVYKAEQESQLCDIKMRAAEQEKANELLNAESLRVLGELRWALAVSTNVRDKD